MRNYLKLNFRMFRVSLGLLILLVGSGESGLLFDSLMEFAMNFAADQIDRALNDPNQNAEDLGTSLIDSADGALGGMLASKKQAMQLEKIFNAVSELSDKIEKLNDYIHDKLDNFFHDLKKILKSVVKHETRLNGLIEYITVINQKYDELQMILKRYYAKNVALSDKSHVLEFAERTVSEAPGELLERLGVMYAFFDPFESTGTFEDGLFFLMAEDLDAQYITYCGNQSAQQRLYASYEAVSIVDYKGYLTLKYCYDILSVFDNTTYSAEQKVIANDFIKRRSGYVDAINQALAQIHRYQRACSPPSYQRDTNFIELEGLYGSYVINELDMDVIRNNDILQSAKQYLSIAKTSLDNIFTGLSLNEAFLTYLHNKHCFQSSCEDIQNTARRIVQGQLDFGDYIYTNRGNESCRGKIFGCKDLGTSSSVCVKPNHGRRYQQINTGTNIYGNDGKCEPEGVNVALEAVGWFPQCSYCLCRCHNSDNNGTNVVKWIDLENHISDIEKNMVITGVKFEKNGNKIDIKIKEGVLKAKGEVPESTWTSGFQGNARYGEIGEWDSKSIVLKSYEADEGYVMTGIRFQHYFNGYFGIQIHCTEFDFDSGMLNASNWHWIDFIKLERLGKELTLDSPDDSTKSPVNYLDSMDGDYATFAMSDLAKTAGGFVVPFIDSQPVETVPGFALSGAGLIHTGHRGYGGFVAFQLSTYDLSGYISVPEQTSST